MYLTQASVSSRTCVLSPPYAFVTGVFPVGSPSTSTFNIYRKTGMAVGLMVTASHNPEVDNGIKMVDPNGGMLSQDWEGYAEVHSDARFFSFLCAWLESSLGESSSYFLIIAASNLSLFSSLRLSSVVTLLHTRGNTNGKTYISAVSGSYRVLACVLASLVHLTRFFPFSPSKELFFVLQSVVDVQWISCRGQHYWYNQLCQYSSKFLVNGERCICRQEYRRPQ